MNRAFIAAANRVTVLADHTKLQAFASFRISSWENIQRLITDAASDRKLLAAIEDQGVEIVFTV